MLSRATTNAVAYRASSMRRMRRRVAAAHRPVLRHQRLHQLPRRRRARRGRLLRDLRLHPQAQLSCRGAHTAQAAPAALALRPAHQGRPFRFPAPHQSADGRSPEEGAGRHRPDGRPSDRTANAHRETARAHHPSRRPRRRRRPAPHRRRSRPPPRTTAMVRVLHASPDAPNVDVYADGGKILSDVPFGGLSDYLKVPAGDLRHPCLRRRQRRHRRRQLPDHRRPALRRRQEVHGRRVRPRRPRSRPTSSSMARRRRQGQGPRRPPLRRHPRRRRADPGRHPTRSSRTSPTRTPPSTSPWPRAPTT